MPVFTMVLVCPKWDLIFPAEMSDLLNLTLLQALGSLLLFFKTYKQEKT